MKNWEKYFERREGVSDEQSMHDDIKEELTDFFNWMDENGFITGNATPFQNHNDNPVDGYINDKRKNSKWAW